MLSRILKIESLIDKILYKNYNAYKFSYENIQRVLLPS